MDPDPDTIRLRTALRDLVALSTFPAAWVGQEPSAIAAGLADLLVGSLCLDFAFVRLSDLKGGVVEVTRGNAWRSFPNWLQHRLSVNGHSPLREIIPDVNGGADGEPCPGIVIPIGITSEGGLVAAASWRTSFPDEIDRLLISVAANQAATACEGARLLYERRRAEEALRDAHNDLERKVAERTAELQRTAVDLLEREAKIRRLVDANIIGIMFWNMDGQILDANDALLRMVGYDREDLLAGRISWTDLTPLEFRDQDAQAIEDLKMKGSIPPFEKEYFRKDGRRVPILIGVATFEPRGNQGVAFVLDLTERKRAEAALRESGEALRESQMELAHASRVATLGHLTASIAHEINQPVAGILSSSQAAMRWLDKADPEAARRSIERVIIDATRTGEVVSGLRALVKKAPSRTILFDMNEAITEVIALTRTEAIKNGVSIETQLAVALSLVRGDRVQLQQVVLNLSMNAIEAMSSSNELTKDLLVSTRADDSGGVLVAVRDSGPGIEPQSAKRLFEPFYTTKPRGMGMGLVICQSIIEAHGGRLSAAANEPRGAVFQFTLPPE